jgi:hypothetical protein
MMAPANFVIYLKQNRHFLRLLHMFSTSFGRPTMCDKCVELDKKIEHYRRFQRAIDDRQMIDGAEKLIAKLEAEKAALHPEYDL